MQTLIELAHQEVRIVHYCWHSMSLCLGPISLFVSWSVWICKHQMVEIADHYTTSLVIKMS